MSVKVSDTRPVSRDWTACKGCFELKNAFVGVFRELGGARVRVILLETDHVVPGGEVKLALKRKHDNSDMDDRAVILNRGVTTQARLTSEGDVL